jgi:K+-sensing histidine kinase KdpD
VLENAAMYSPQTSPITIEAGISGDRLVLTVRDRGPGLRGGEAERVFDRSYRGVESTSNQFSSGMGLAITRGLIALQNGKVRAENHPDGGALFTLAVPTASRAVPESAVPA